MQGLMRKGAAVALAAVLLFASCFPVPSGVRALDGMRYERAQAAAPAVAVPAIAAILAACGVYAAGSTAASYGENMQQLSDGFLSWCGDNLYHEDIDAAVASVNSAIDAAGNIDLDALAASGILGVIPTFAQHLLDSGAAVEGETSLDANAERVIFGESSFFVTDSIPYLDKVADYVQKAYDAGYVHFVGYNYWVNGGAWPEYTLFFSTDESLSVFNGSTTDPHDWRINEYYAKIFLQFNSNGSVRDLTYRVTTGNTIYGVDSFRSTVSFLSPDTVLVNGATSASFGSVSVSSAVIAQGVADGTRELVSGKVRPFEPTAEQLEAGYSAADVVAAIGVVGDSLAGVISKIDGVYSLLSPVAGIAANVQNIRDWWNDSKAGFASSALGVASLVTWAGETPFATVMQTVIDGVAAIPGAVSSGASAVLDGVRAIPGAVAGAASDVVAGVQGLAADIAGAAQAVVTSVLGLPATIAAALSPAEVGEGTGLAVTQAVRDEFDAIVREKAPFCYVLRLQQVGHSIAASFDSNPSFYVDVPMPYSGDAVRFDAGMVLNHTWGGMSVARYMRVLLTALVCSGLVALAVRVAMRTVGAGTGD